MRASGRRALILVALGVAWWLALPTPAAWACSCDPTPMEDLFANVDVVFIGTATSIDKGARRGEFASTAWHLDVESVQKGDVGATATVFMPEGDGGCGLSREEPGMRVQVFGWITDGDINTHICAGTNDLAELPAFLPKTGPTLVLALVGLSATGMGLALRRASLR